MELLMSICLLSAPADCRDESLVVSMETTTPMACMMIAPQTIAQWQQSHPKWRVTRWTCGEAGRRRIAV